MRFCLEFWRFLRARKKYWVVPILILFLGVGTLLGLAEGSVLAPFLYSLF